jgi:hypothetical protein
MELQAIQYLVEAGSGYVRIDGVKWGDCDRIDAGQDITWQSNGTVANGGFTICGKVAADGDVRQANGLVEV